MKFSTKFGIFIFLSRENFMLISAEHEKSFVTSGLAISTVCSGVSVLIFRISMVIPGPDCSKLTTLLVNKTLKFQMLISQICQYILLNKLEKLLQCKSFSHFINKKNSVYLVVKW